MSLKHDDVGSSLTEAEFGGSGLHIIPGMGQGTVLYRSGDGKIAGLTPGDDGEALLTGGSGASPRWGNPVIEVNRKGIFVPVTTVNAYGNFDDQNVWSWSPTATLYIIGIDGWMGLLSTSTPAEESFELGFHQSSALSTARASAYMPYRIYKWDLHRHGAGPVMLQRDMWLPAEFAIKVSTADTIYCHRVGWNGGPKAGIMADIECTIYYFYP